MNTVFIRPRGRRPPPLAPRRVAHGRNHSKLAQDTVLKTMDLLFKQMAPRDSIVQSAGISKDIDAYDTDNSAWT